MAGHKLGKGIAGIATLGCLAASAICAAVEIFHVKVDLMAPLDFRTTQNALESSKVILTDHATHIAGEWAAAAAGVQILFHGAHHMAHRTLDRNHHNAVKRGKHGQGALWKAALTALGHGD